MSEPEASDSCPGAAHDLHSLGKFSPLDPDVSHGIVLAACSIPTSSVCTAWRELLLEFRSSHVALAHTLLGKWKLSGSDVAGGYFDHWCIIYELRADGKYWHWGNEGDCGGCSERYSRGRWHLRPCLQAHDHDEAEYRCHRSVVFLGNGEEIDRQNAVKPYGLNAVQSCGREKGLHNFERVNSTDIGFSTLHKSFKIGVNELVK